MGSDLYELSFRAHRQHTRAEAIAQARMYGMNADLATSAFEAEDAWVELCVHERSVHQDAPVQWDRVGILRFVDEAVVRGGGFAWEATPLALALPGLWGMSFDAEPAKRIPVHVMDVEYTPTSPPGTLHGSAGETVDFSVFLPQRFAPNLAEVRGLDSRAWGGAIDWDTHHAPTRRRPRRALMKPLRRSVLRHGREVVRFDGDEIVRSSAADEMDAPLDVAPRTAGGAWILGMYGELWAVTADGGAERVAHLSGKGRKASVKALAVDARGDVWIATTFGVFCKRGANAPEEVLAEQGALEAHAICVAPDGRIVVGTKKGVSIRGVDGAWTHYTDGFAITPITGLCAMEDGVIWAAGLTGVTRINADGSRDKFGKRQGFEYTTKFIPLPDGSVLGSTSMSTARILAGASAAVPCPAVEAASPLGLVAWCLDGSGALHCSTGDGNILVLASGEPPACFVWSNTCDELRKVPPVPRALCFSPEGDLFCVGGAGALVVARAAELREAREAVPLNTELRQFPQIGPLHLGAAAPGAEAIDFQGKTVVITGTLSTMTRAQAEAALVARGAKLSGTLGKGTDLLLAGLKAGSKLQKAEKLGVRVVGEDALRAPPAKAAPPARLDEVKV